MDVDKIYCSSSFLSFRTIADSNKTFAEGITPNLFDDNFERTQVNDDYDLKETLEKQIINAVNCKKVALALSGGIDSAILAKFLPMGSKAYTFQCIVPGIEVANEISLAKKYANECKLNHEVIEIYWEDFENYAPLLMRHKGAPIHSIEVQIYKAAKKAKESGFDAIIFGESADLNYGGLSGLLSRDWRFGEFIERYNYVQPYSALKEFQLITEPLLKYERDGFIDVFEFCRGFFLREAMGSYSNACECAGIELVVPYANTRLAVPLDYERIRRGENKYIIRDLFKQLYPTFEIPTKLPMPRATNEWLKNWKGPTRNEFWPHCTDNMTGDQKWLIWVLERFLNMLDEQ